MHVHRFQGQAAATAKSQARNNVLPDMKQAVWTCLIGEADASTKADTANDEHGKVLGKGTQDGANAEGSSPQYHNQLPATNARHRASEEAEESACSMLKKLIESGKLAVQSMLTWAY